jgi:hypothetical protein
LTCFLFMLTLLRKMNISSEALWVGPVLNGDYAWCDALSVGERT